MTLRIVSERQSFADRRDAGRMLADQLETMDLEDPVALGIPRGGVVVAASVAEALSWPLDICLVRKLGAPNNPELAIGSLLEGGDRYINDRIARSVGADRSYIEEEVWRQQEVLSRRTERYRRVRPRLDLEGRTVVVLDDGIATGATMRAAVQGFSSVGYRALVVAVPCAPRARIEDIAELCDETLCLNASRGFGAVSQFYREFGQVTDEEVLDILRSFGDCGHTNDRADRGPRAGG